MYNVSIKVVHVVEKNLVQLESWEAQKMPGVWLVPDGNNKRWV